VLAALIIHAVSHLMKVGEMRRFRRLVPREFWLAMLTLLSVLIVRPDAPLFYANAELVRDAIEQAAGSARAVVLVLDGNDNLDITSAEQLGKLADGLAARNVPLGLAHVHGPVLEMAERSGLLASVGADRVFPTTPAAVAWAQSVASTPAPKMGRPADSG
jgi:MFS superfamily sulfate permease-like transporter